MLVVDYIAKWRTQVQSCSHYQPSSNAYACPMCDQMSHQFCVLGLVYHWVVRAQKLTAGKSSVWHQERCSLADGHSPTRSLRTLDPKLEWWRLRKAQAGQVQTVAASGQAGDVAGSLAAEAAALALGMAVVWLREVVMAPSE